MINAGIIGGAGYTAGELLRLLVNHPLVQIKYVHSTSNAGKLISNVHTDLFGELDLHFTNEFSNDVDVLFLCVGHNEALKFLQSNSINDSVKVIDLSQDFRLIPQSKFQNRQFIYGLPELNKEHIIKANSIANPGCFATCIQLGLLPLAKANLLLTFHTTGITGSTGAGQSLQATSHFSWRSNNIQAYKTLQHQHQYEILQSLEQLQNNKSEMMFVPWRGDFTRGIFVTSYLKCALGIEESLDLFTTFYQNHPFVIIHKEMIDLKLVVNTNKCVIYLEKIGDQLVVHSAIDNLLKGASGQALQNMNLMFGLNETTGLQLKASKF